MKRLIFVVILILVALLMGCASLRAEQCNKQQTTQPSSTAIDPLSWIQGKRTVVYVDANSSWSEPLRGIVEGNLRERGALVVSTSGRRRYSRRAEEIDGIVYVAELYARRHGNYAVVQIRITDLISGVLQAFVTTKLEIYYSYNYYRSYTDRNYKYFELATREALRDLR